MSDDLYDRPDLYDLIGPPDPAMEQFLVSEALRGGRRVLELACGTGRFTIPMALAGATVVGGDLSTAMLARARGAAAERSAKVSFAELDMRNFDLDGETFDTVIVAANSILHLNSADDFTGFFGSVLKHLAPEGRLLFDAFVPNTAMLSAGPDVRQIVNRVTHPSLGAVTLEATIDYDPIAQLSHIDWYWSTSAKPDFWRNRLVLRQIFPEEMPLLLASGGFRLVERYGGFDRRPFTRGTWRQVCIAQPA